MTNRNLKSSLHGEQLFHMELSLYNHWTDQIPDKYIVKRTTTRRHGFIAPNEEIIPLTYAWKLAFNQETVEDTQYIPAAGFMKAFEAVEILACMKELIKNEVEIPLMPSITLTQSFEEMLEEMLIVKPEGMQLTDAPALVKKLVKFRNNIDMDLVVSALEELNKKEKRMLFLSRMPWEIKSEYISTRCWLDGQIDIFVWARFAFKAVSEECIL